jgi:putative MFS transporter
MNSLGIINEAPVSSFHRKLLFACCGGPFLDGYVLSIIGVALVGITRDLAVTSVESGLIGAASLVGIFFGAIIFGSLTDRVGREKMYALDLTVLVAACFASAFITDAWQLIALRFVLGLAVGADYPIATSLLTEFTPTSKRGFMIGVSGISWLLGAMTAFTVGALIVEVSGGYHLWRWMLGSSVFFGLVVVLSRRGIPESPRWLLRKGRVREAEDVIELVYGKRVHLAADQGDTPVHALTGASALRQIFAGGYLKRTVMCGLLYFAQITPQYAIFTFGPVILNKFGLSGGALDIVGSAVISALFVLGAIPVLRLVETWGRRPMCVIPFALMTLPLFALWLAPHGPAWFIIAAFCFYAFVSGGPSLLEWIYPNELFPTEVRATALGVAVGVSRIGAATGTYLLPIGLEKLGTGNTMLIGAVVTFVGFVACLLWAPETKGQTLEASSSVAPGARAVQPAPVETAGGRAASGR